MSQPTIWAAREAVLHYCSRPETERLDMYIDLHGHANKRGCFLFGKSTHAHTHYSTVEPAFRVAQARSFCSTIFCNSSFDGVRVPLTRREQPGLAASARGKRATGEARCAQLAIL
eukprot:4642212-Pyramimonas_sp.AAC.1